jgi:hypothetical protein
LPGPSVKSSVFAEKVNPSANESLCRCTFGGGFYSINHNGGGFSKIIIFWGRIEKRQKNGGGFLRMEADRSCVTWNGGGLQGRIVDYGEPHIKH